MSVTENSYETFKVGVFCGVDSIDPIAWRKSEWVTSASTLRVPDFDASNLINRLKADGVPIVALGDMNVLEYHIRRMLVRLRCSTRGR